MYLYNYFVLTLNTKKCIQLFQYTFTSLCFPHTFQDDRETPAMGMKERTALAAFQVHKMLSVAGEKDAYKVAGKLKKGKYVHIFTLNYGWY